MTLNPGSASRFDDVEEGFCLSNGIGEVGQQGGISLLFDELILHFFILADDGEKAVFGHAPDSIGGSAFLTLLVKQDTWASSP